MDQVSHLIFLFFLHLEQNGIMGFEKIFGVI